MTYSVIAVEMALGDTVNTITVVLWVVIAVIVIRTVWVLARVSRERRVAARASPQQQLKWRGEFMLALIDMVGRDTSPSGRLSKLRRQLGWTEGHALLVRDYLSGKGLVERVSWMATEQEPFKTLGRLFGGNRVRLTGAGLDEAERAASGPTENLPHIVAYRSTVTIAGRDAAVGSPGAYGRDTAINSPGAHGRDTAIDSPAAYSRGMAIQSPGATQTLIEHGLDPDLLDRWIEMYRRGLRESTSLSERRVRHAESLLDDLEDAVEAGDPARVESLGQSLLAIAEGVAGSAVFAAIVAFAEKFPFGL